ncbi:short chain dehydrogenase family protein [Collimonas arenae]|uniref:Short chain dehydrogenase family protein n=1 Tax=Collimonas arenae TaxID=279058 RepID=A0A127QNE2_9BURK|nr:SDR family NAD(P)-dependent oxidoreductase [Collimonas arenae]AMP01668.1 short chain dehydrogenase family protein [Collimonas arenae]AMP11564.1 short chain dehydrogenase family protein [Collimonas arenae]
MKNLQGKVAVITGGAEGIGKGIAVRAAAEGMKLVLADINAAKLETTVAEFKAQGIEVIGVPTDVANEEQVNALAAKAFAQFGNVHLLVNNAGVAVAKPAWETTQKDWDWVMGVNFYGVTHALRAFIPTMLKHGEEGHIVNTASMAGLTSQPSLASYNASKHAVVTVSEGLHHDLVLRQSRIKVSVLCPGWVKTGIGHSERNRANAAHADRVLDPVAAKVGMAVLQAVENGIPVQQVADDVFDAIRLERFYILTHPEMKQAIQVRMEDILLQRAPTLLRI